MLKLSVIADIHHGPSRGTKQGDKAFELFDRYLQHINRTNPDFVVELGDRISDVGLEEDQVLLQEISGQLHRIKFPRAHLVGNHDVHLLSIEENENVLGVSLASRSIDLNGYHLVFWNAQTKIDYQYWPMLGPDDLDWLRNDLASSTLPAIIFTHMPLNSGTMKGNFYFDKAYPAHAQYTDDESEKIREVIETTGHVILCVNGHAHWNAYHCIDGVHYVTIPSLTETFTTFPAANEAWADIIVDQTIQIEIYGKTPMAYRLPIKVKGSHWANIHKSYAPASQNPA